MTTSSSTYSTNASWLWSFEGSGTTWLRILLELVTQQRTGSIYHQDRSERAYFCTDSLPPGACSGALLVIKTHGDVLAPAVRYCPSTPSRAVILLRAPGAAIWSEWQRRLLFHIANCRGTIPCRNNFSFDFKTTRAPFEARWLEWAVLLAEQWNRTVAAQLAFAEENSTQFVHYEELISPQTRGAALAQVAAFGGVAISPARVACAFEHDALARRARDECRWNHSTCPNSAQDFFSRADEHLAAVRAKNAKAKRSAFVAWKAAGLSAFAWSCVHQVAERAGYRDLFNLAVPGAAALQPRGAPRGDAHREAPREDRVRAHRMVESARWGSRLRAGTRPASAECRKLSVSGKVSPWLCGGVGGVRGRG